MPENREDAVTKLIGALNRHDLSAVVALCHADYAGQDVAAVGEQHGPEGLSAGLRRYLNAFPDMLISSLEEIRQDDRVAIRWVARGTHLGWLMNIPPTGQIVTLEGTWFLTLADGKIRKAATVWDVAGLLRRIGLLPELQP